MLIYYLTESITTYLAKQYEIIAIILIRRTFDDLANLSSMERVYDVNNISGLLWTFGGLLLLFLLIFCFYQLSGYKHVRIDESACSNKEKNFILIKKVLSLILFAVFIFVFMASFIELYHFPSLSLNNLVSVLKEMSNTFFGTFFTALILTEVLLLLFTYRLTESFSKVIRNSGFIISTIMLKLSFNTDGEINMLFILIAVSFGVMVLGISKFFDKMTGKRIDN
ncbi:MAG: hypothetical protein LBQ60_18090 [Bacteroidales bacterium]|nr:hypothetical protein [Bacteroidales bacterium]